MHRMLLLDKNHMTCFAPKGRHLGTIIERNEDNGKGTEIATVIGGDPIIAIASQCGRHWAPMRWAWPAACAARR